LVPPAFAAAMERRGISKVAVLHFPNGFGPVLNCNGRQRHQSAVLSLSAPGVYFGDTGEACDLARACNEYSASVRAA